MYCTIRVAKSKALISFAVTAKLICVFVFAYAKGRFSHNEAQIMKAYEIGSSDLSRFYTHEQGYTLDIDSVILSQIIHWC